MGDDLGSDDELLLLSNIHEEEGSPSKPDVVEVGEKKVQKKRKVSEDLESKSPSSRKKKVSEDFESDLASSRKKKSKSPAKLMLEAGRHLEEQSVEQQASFLSIALRHHSLLASNEEGDELLPKFFAASQKQSLVDRLKDVLSLKKIKKWGHTCSPAVVIVCISARRAIAILKELAPLKARTAKLFPKNGSVTAQCEQLRSTNFGLAVGTPHRLEILCQQENGLNFENTQLIVFDSHVSNKAFTVVSLPDTAPHCATLVKQHILPQLKKRGDIRLAFF